MTLVEIRVNSDFLVVFTQDLLVFVGELFFDLTSGSHVFELSQQVEGKGT